MSLEPCPDSPNCVSTLADSSDSVHYIESVSVSREPSEVIDAVAQAVTQARGKITQRSDDRLAATFSTRFFRFKDDVMFFVDGDELHFRSASRIGHSDLGVNRRRMTRLVDAINTSLECG